MNFNSIGSSLMNTVKFGSAKSTASTINYTQLSESLAQDTVSFNNAQSSSKSTYNAQGKPSDTDKDK